MNEENFLGLNYGQLPQVELILVTFTLMLETTTEYPKYKRNCSAEEVMHVTALTLVHQFADCKKLRIITNQIIKIWILIIFLVKTCR